MQVRFYSFRFQSMLPARGATARQNGGFYDLQISIHAPRTGSDRMRWKLTARETISIHAPRTGSDTSFWQYSISASISIHAPRTGSDCNSKVKFWHRCHFNPRSPHGERRLSPSCLTRALHFNPRSPHGERPGGDRASRTAPIFQSTLPARGATLKLGFPALRRIFQSTLPARGATYAVEANCTGDNFNPRSPHGERRRRR